MNNESLEQFIIRRRAELKQAEELLRKKLAEIEQENEQLLAAAATARVPVDQEFTRQKLSASRVPRRLKLMTIKEAVIEILTDHSGGMFASEILKELNSRHDTDYARESLSPQISRLRQEGRIELSDGIWKVTVRNGSGDDAPKNADVVEKSDDFLGRES